MAFVYQSGWGTVLCLAFICLASSVTRSCAGSTTEPSFTSSERNVTLEAGRTAVLRCAISDLGQYKVIWMFRSLILTFDDRRIIDDRRMSVERPYEQDWNLHIRYVKPEDSGSYTCMINTEPTKMIAVTLNVLGPCEFPPGVNATGDAFHGQRVRFECDPGLKPKVSSSITCNNGTWIPEPLCVPKTVMFLEAPGVVKVVQGSDALLSCGVNDENATVMWKRGKKFLRPAGDFVTSTKSMPRKTVSVLIIRKAEIRKHKRVYTCQVTRRSGHKMESQTKLGIYKEGKVPAAFPRFAYELAPTLTAQVGETPILPCPAVSKGRPLPSGSYRWIGEDGFDVLSGNASRIRVEDNGSLEIASFRQSDSGKYQCFATNAYGTLASPLIWLKNEVQCRDRKGNAVAVGDVFAANASDPCVTCTCGIDGNPEACASIVCDVPSCPHRWIEDTCCDFECLPEATPTITQAPRDMYVIESLIVSFFCEASGGPSLDVYWKKNNTKLSASSSSRYTVTRVSNGSVLRIEPVKMRDNASMITCVAENDNGIVKANALLHVYSGQDVPVGYPRIILSPKLKAVEKGSQTTFNCQADARTKPNPPTIYWLKDSVPLNTADSRIEVSRNGTLTISDSMESDQGAYECVAETDEGVAYSYRANLYVRVRRIPPHFTSIPEDVVLERGADHNLTCTAVGSPMPVMTWWDEGIELKPTEEVSIGRTVLILKNVNESKSYTCRATSILGRIEQDVTVAVKACDRVVYMSEGQSQGWFHSPDYPTAYKPGINCLLFSFYGDINEIVRITIKKLDLKSPLVISEDHSLCRDWIRIYQNVDVPEVHEDSVYDVEFCGNISSLKERTFYSSGRGLVLEFHTDADSRGSHMGFKGAFEFVFKTPVTPPRNVNARVITPQTIFVEWEEPESSNGIIQGYKVLYTDTPGLPVALWDFEDIKTGDTNATITGLQPNTTYTVTVLAYTSTGEGPLYSPVRLLTRQAVRGQPRNLRAKGVSPNEIEIRWDPPLGDEKITHYKLYFNDASQYQIGEVSLPPEYTSYILNQLVPDTVYQFRLSTISYRGEGDKTPIAQAKTLEFIPGAPEHVSVAFVNFTAIHVQWRPPTGNERIGIIRGYYIYCVELDENEEPLIRTEKLEDTGDGNITEAVIVNLKPDTKYQITVAGYTGKGDGYRSIPVIVTTTGTDIRCRDRKGNVVAVGDVFAANASDPCVTCTCGTDGNPEACASIVCDVPSCPHRWIEDTCCDFECLSEGRPEPPHGVALASCGPRSADITWMVDAENAASISQFVVQYNTSFSPDNWTTAAIASDPDARQARIPLSPWANYTFRVMALNIEGPSEPSEPTHRCFTPPARPDKNPTGIRTITDKPAYLVVEWEGMPPIEHNGPGFRYVLTVTYANEPIRTLVIEDWKATRKEMYMHTLYTPVGISIRAENAIGRCPQEPATIIGYTGEGRPTVTPGMFELVVPGSLTSSNVSFRWNPVDKSPEAMKGSFQGYKIVLWEAGDEENTRREILVNSPNVIGDKETMVVQSLPHFKTMKAQIFVVNSYYMSEGSDIVTFTTLRRARPPGPPEITGNDNIFLRLGDVVEMSCSSKGGNPPPTVVWRKNDSMVDSSFHTVETEVDGELLLSTINNFTFTAQPSDNGVEYRCGAFNTLNANDPVFASHRVIVHFPPEDVTISAKRLLDSVSLSCRASNSYPPAEIKWFSRGLKLKASFQKTVPSQEGGFVTISDIEVPLATGRETDIYQCIATNEGLGISVVDVATVGALPQLVEMEVTDTQCRDRKGNVVAVGETFAANASDPCVTCTCGTDGNPEACASIICDVPSCPHRWIEDTCCDFECLPEVTNCTDRSGNVVQVGEIYKPNPSDPCEECICESDPRMRTCSNQGCDSPTCPVFDWLPDTCCDYVCKDVVQTAITVRQVGATRALVQWEVEGVPSDDTEAQEVWYATTGGGQGPSDWTKLRVASTNGAALLSSLHPNRQYAVKVTGVVQSTGQYFGSGEHRFSFDARVGSFLLIDPAQLGTVSWYPGFTTVTQSFYLNLNKFAAVYTKTETCPDGRECSLIEFFDNDNPRTLVFHDQKDVIWVKAHL